MRGHRPSLPATKQPCDHTTDNSTGRAERSPRQDYRGSVVASASAAQHESNK